MQDSSPSDLAVAFRSLPRRLRDARGDLPDEEIREPLDAIDRLVADSARLLAVTPDPARIAEAISEVPANRWDDSILAGLRGNALDLGRWLRTVEDLARAD